MVCLEVSLGTWGSDPVMYQLLSIQNRRSLPIRNKHPEMGQAPTSQARPRDTDHLRPSNLAARTLSLVEHTLSKFGRDPCPVRRRLVAAVKCYLRKKRFFSCTWASNRNDPSLPTALLAGFSTMKGNPVLFSVFWYDNYRPQHTYIYKGIFAAAGSRPP